MTVNCCTTAETSCIANPQQIEVIIDLESYSRPTCNKLRATSHDASTVLGVINKLDRRRVLLTTRSTCRGEIFKVQSLGQNSGGKYPNFWRYPRFLVTQCRIDGRKPPCQMPARFVQSFRYNIGLRWTNRRTDKQTDDDSKCRANIASRGKILRKISYSNIRVDLLSSNDYRHCAE